MLTGIQDEKLQVVQSPIEDFVFEPEAYDLISAQFALPFVPKARLTAAFGRIRDSLKPGGLFTGQFFGTRDSWNKPGSEGRKPEITFLPREKVDNLLAGMKVIEITEEDKMGGTATGETKRWHVFHVIAQRKF